MRRRLHIYQQNTRIPTSEPATAPAMGTFQQRPFENPAPTADAGQQIDLKPSLMQAQRYGHHLGQMHDADVSPPQVTQSKRKKGRSMHSEPGLPVNDQPDLEAQADKLGEMAARGENVPGSIGGTVASSGGIVQCKVDAVQCTRDGVKKKKQPAKQGLPAATPSSSHPAAAPAIPERSPLRPGSHPAAAPQQSTSHESASKPAAAPSKGKAPAEPSSDTTAAGSTSQGPLTDFVSNPKLVVGKSADEIAEQFNAAGFKAVVEESTKKGTSGKAVQVRIKGHPEIANIQVHPGGGRHTPEGVQYWKISTNTQGKIWVAPRSFAGASELGGKVVYYD